MTMRHGDKKKKSIKIPREYIRKTDPNRATLKKSIRDYGQVYPVIIDENRFLLDGKGRMESTKGLYVNTKTVKIDPKERLQFMLSLNLSQEKINPIDLAQAFKTFLEQKGVSIRQGARMLGIGKTKIEYHLKLLDIPKEIQQKIKEGKISPYSKDVEQHIYKSGKKNIESRDEFSKRSERIQYVSIINRITSLKGFIEESNLDNRKYKNIATDLKELIILVNRKIVGDRNGV